MALEATALSNVLAVCQRDELILSNSHYNPERGCVVSTSRSMPAQNQASLDSTHCGWSSAFAARQSARYGATAATQPRSSKMRIVGEIVIQCPT